MHRFAKRIATLFSAAILAGGSLHAQSVTISPGYLNIPAGGKQQYTATVTGLSPATVTWSVNGGGAIDQTGFFTAPATVSAATSVLVVATSTANSKIQGVMYANVQPPGPVIAAISPNPLPAGNDTLTFTPAAGMVFTKGAVANCAGANLTTKLVSPTSVTAALYVSPGWKSVTCTVSNAGTSPSVPFTLAVSGSSSGGSGGGSGGGGGGTPAPVVSPAAVTVVLGLTQQFSATNTTGWSATAGTITAAGLYTAPAATTPSGTDLITATGPGGTGTATVTLLSNVPPVIQSLNPAALPLGSFTATVTGTGFTPKSTAQLGGTPLSVTAQSATSLSISGFASNSGSVNLTVSNGSIVSAPFAVQAGNPNALVSAAAARRFLEQAAFGPSPSDAASLQTLGFQGWLNQQFAMPQISNYNAQAASSQGGLANQFLVNAVMNPDQLRQKVAFALSQIFVTSINTIIWNDSMIPYEQMLMADAFSNYRQILGDVTLSPTMGQYLNMANNAMANPASGTVANENYAREVMQLFTIGTTMLNPDGTPQRDSNNLLVPSYGQATISETARVFTGWTYQPSSGAVQWNDYINPAGPMVPFPAEHDMGSKQLVNGYAEPAGLSPQQDLNNALDNIFNHPNVGPFVAKLLIQHLVKSNPSPAYAQRIGAVFANNGQGVRGDMKAMIAAILLDPEARANDNGGSDQLSDGHLQEPILFVSGMVRAFGGQMTNQNYFAWDLLNMGQDLYNAPSVFNYYSPTFVPPGSALLGPEFQIDTPDSAVYRANVVAGMFGSWSNPLLSYGPGTTIDVTPFLALSPNPATLVAALDLTLTHGTMPAGMKQDIVAAVTNDTNGNLSRVETGAWLILTSSYYNVWH